MPSKGKSKTKLRTLAISIVLQSTLVIIQSSQCLIDTDQAFSNSRHPTISQQPITAVVPNHFNSRNFPKFDLLEFDGDILLQRAFWECLKVKQTKKISNLVLKIQFSQLSLWVRPKLLSLDSLDWTYMRLLFMNVLKNFKKIS